MEVEDTLLDGDQSAPGMSRKSRQETIRSRAPRTAEMKLLRC